MTVATLADGWRTRDGSVFFRSSRWFARLSVHTEDGCAQLLRACEDETDAERLLGRWQDEYPLVRTETKVRLPVGPLLQQIRLAGGLAVLGFRKDHGVEMALVHGRRHGLTVAKADELAVTVLRTHPMLIWGDAWLG